MDPKKSTLIFPIKKGKKRPIPMPTKQMVKTPTIPIDQTIEITKNISSPYTTTTTTTTNIVNLPSIRTTDAPEYIESKIEIIPFTSVKSGPDLRPFIRELLYKYSIGSLETEDSQRPKFYKFMLNEKSMKIWQAAFTHESYKIVDPEAEDYEQYETYGDEVLNNVFFELLKEKERRSGRKYTNSELSQLKMNYMSKQKGGQVDLAKQMNLHEYIRMGPDLEENTLQSYPDDIIGDVFESLFGALYEVVSNYFADPNSEVQYPGFSVDACFLMLRGVLSINGIDNKYGEQHAKTIITQNLNGTIVSSDDLVSKDLLITVSLSRKSLNVIKACNNAVGQKNKVYVKLLNALNELGYNENLVLARTIGNPTIKSELEKVASERAITKLNIDYGIGIKDLLNINTLKHLGNSEVRSQYDKCNSLLKLLYPGHSVTIEKLSGKNSKLVTERGTAITIYGKYDGKPIVLGYDYGNQSDIIPKYIKILESRVSTMQQ